ncbi:DNA primase protein [Rhizobium phage RHph_TM39]|uniref:DNA primase protein n=1 Tax=Rhizobium phage RHph_Y65 TaxID=2509785 RepID=A0A7S5R831_9CAUD|nr:DNA primase protein [Rhizobium phage RHph_Y65]QIG71766.1 DNA primase protein [Rhizobium phage RHph_TM40]QIG72127.1 DNA primase protein [Rhizobium phage RHph_TM2_3B]QIG72489.1 DNA primase protein [Rhizobium phage RHph_TM3_3_6]QIG77264.1 DNA primase protein [Rhizobium phage RHph_TM39]QIG77879.1 DNA primase protein [Rhizobium phage RHph_TM61]
MSNQKKPSYKKTYEILDPNDPPTLAKETEDHYVFYCPNCVEKRGKPDKDGRLYWSKPKQVGYCFKCVTSFFPAADENLTPEENELFHMIGRTLSKMDKDESIVDPPPMDFSFDALDYDLLTYLKNRNPFLPSLVKLLGCRAWYGKINGVAFPFIYKDYVGKFQVRFDTKIKDKRYYTSPGKDKLPYSPTGLFTDFKLRDEPTITICEGVFDAIALMILGYPNPIAVLGKTLTAFQIRLLRTMMPSNAFVVMDDWEISKAIKGQLMSNVISMEDVRIVSYGDDVDPEEYLVEEIKDPEKFKVYASNVAEIIKTYS